VNQRQYAKCRKARQLRKVAGLIYDDFDRLGKPETSANLAAEITNALGWHSLYGKPYIRGLITNRRGWVKPSRRCAKLAFR